MQLATMPTQEGQDPGFVTLAGGWSWALPRLSRRTDLAWELVQQMLDVENMVAIALADNQIAIREDVATHEDYVDYSPSVGFFTDLVPHATYRPAYAPYPQVSAAIQAAMETVMTGQGTVEEAQATYDEDVVAIVGEDAVEDAG